MTDVEREKVNTLTTNLRRLWPKYDSDLNQYVQGMDNLLFLFEHFFRDSKLQEDHLQFRN